MPDTLPSVTEGRWISEAARRHAADAAAGVASGRTPPTWTKTRKGSMILTVANSTFAMIRKTGNVWEARVTGWEWPVERSRGNLTGFYPIETFWSADKAAMACVRVITSSNPEVR